MQLFLIATIKHLYIRGIRYLCGILHRQKCKHLTPTRKKKLLSEVSILNMCYQKSIRGLENSLDTTLQCHPLHIYKIKFTKD
jgi:hypothetical protein